MAHATADAVVIGGGVMGCSIACQLAKRGFGKIILCERDDGGVDYDRKLRGAGYQQLSHDVF